MIKWAGILITFFGVAHTVGALTAEGAARHADAWFGRELWGDDLAEMSPAMSAYWLSVNSFGPPLALAGLTVLWLSRRGVTPPPFLGWVLGVWAAVDLIVSGPGSAQTALVLVAAGLLIAGARRARSNESAEARPQSSK